MKVKIKKLIENAIIPFYAKDSDAGMDLTATSFEIDVNGNYSYGTGLAMEIPKGYVGLLFPRSSISKTDLTLRNSVGIIDSGYRGEIILKFKGDKIGSKKTIQSDSVLYKNIKYNIGDRVGQIIIMPFPTIEFEETEELTDSERGTDGFGSTNNI